MNLATDRLLLRPVEVSDLDVMHQLYLHPAVRKYLCDDQLLPVEQISEFIQTSRQTFRESNYGLWMIFEKATGALIGQAGLWSFFEEGQPQLLYLLHPDFQGKGYATEAGREVLRFAFEVLNFAYADASCDAPNVASVKVMERLKMTYLKEEQGPAYPVVFYRLHQKNREIFAQ